MDNRESALAATDVRREVLSTIRKSERTLNTFVERMAKNETFKTQRPNTHRFFESVNNFRAVRGRMTDNQKVAINREIDKHIEFFITLRTARVVTSSLPENTTQAASDTPPLDDSQAVEDEREGMVSA